MHGLSFRRSKSSSDWSVKVSKAGYHKNIPHDFMATYVYNQYIYILIHTYIYIYILYTYIYIYLIYRLKSRQTIGFYTLGFLARESHIFELALHPFPPSYSMPPKKNPVLILGLLDMLGRLASVDLLFFHMRINGSISDFRPVGLFNLWGLQLKVAEMIV